jgi:hypothetical protein
MFIKLPLILLGILVGGFLLLLVLRHLGSMSWGPPNERKSQTPTTHRPARPNTRCPKGKVLVKSPGIDPFCTTAENAQVFEEFVDPQTGAWRGR